MAKQPTTTKQPEMAIKKQPKDLAQKLQSMPKVADYFANPGEAVKTFINQHPVRRSDDPYGDGNPSEKIKKDKTQSSKVDAQFGRDIQVAERVLTPDEKEEKERLVKKMKPVEKWQKRYGKRGEEVMYATATKMAKEETELDEAATVDHDRYERSHGKRASGKGYWMFTNKARGTVDDYDDEKKIHRYNGSFSDAKKSAIEWAKKHGHHTAYVMEETELEEGGMPGSVIRSKQKYAAMSDQEFADLHGHKPEEQLRQMAWTHGYGKMSPHYWNRVQKAKAKAAQAVQQQNNSYEPEGEQIDERNKLNKMLKNLHARKVGATRMQNHGSPELNRIAALKKGRELMKNSYEPEGEELDEDSHKDHFRFLLHLQKANIPIAARPSKEEALQLVNRHGDADRAGHAYVRRYLKIKNAAKKVQEEVEIKEQVLLELGEPMSPAPATSDNPGAGDQNAGPQTGDGSSSDRDGDESDDADEVNDEVKQAKEHLEGIALSSAKLFEDIPDDADIPNWILEKLALSEKFLKSVEKEIGDMSDDQDTDDEEDNGEGDNDEEPSPKEKPTAFGGGKVAMAKESVDLTEAKKKKSPQDKFFDRIKKVSGYDAKEVLSRPAPGEKPAAVKEGVKLGKRASLAQTLAKLHK